MNGSGPGRAELIVAGVGGQGVLFAGQVVAQAAIRRYKHISYMPSYGTEKRGGHSECTVVLSDEEIASPVLDQAGAVLLLDGGAASIYEDRVRPGGLMIVEKAELTYQPNRADINFLPVSGLEIAVRTGGAVVNNLIMLGVYTKLTQALAADLIVEEIKKQAGSRTAVLTRNTEAFSRGLELGATLSN